MIEEVSSGARRFLARLANAYRTKLDRDEHKLYLEKLAAYEFTTEQWESILDEITHGPEKRYTFPELPLLFDFTDRLRQRLAPPAAEFELVSVNGVTIAKRKEKNAS